MALLADVLALRCYRLVEGETPTEHAIRQAPHIGSPLVSKPSTASTSQSRRARRAAERRTNAPVASASPKRRSPILLITAIVGGIGIVVLGALILSQSKPAVADTTGLVTPTSQTPLALADGRALGKADAPVTLEVWTDFQCPVCGQFARTVEPLLVSKYVTPGTLRIVHHDAAFQGAKSSSPYDESIEPAAGARCAADLGAYWPFQDWVFANQNGENQGAFSATRLVAMASAAGLDVSKWKACLATGTAQAGVKTETAEAVAAGVNATPTMRLNGETIVGLKSITTLGAKIEAAAAAATGG
jgi:protein-disulfide isomerase